MIHFVCFVLEYHRGEMYMYYSVYDTGKSQYIVGFEMYDPVTPNWDTYKVLVRPGEHSAANTTLKTYWWEAYTDFEVAEGPQMIKSPNGKYYLTCKLNFNDYYEGDIQSYFDETYNKKLYKLLYSPANITKIKVFPPVINILWYRRRNLYRGFLYN